MVGEGKMEEGGETEDNGGGNRKLKIGGRRRRGNRAEHVQKLMSGLENVNSLQGR